MRIVFGRLSTAILVIQLTTRDPGARARLTFGVAANLLRRRPLMVAELGGRGEVTVGMLMKRATTAANVCSPKMKKKTGLVCPAAFARGVSIHVRRR